MVRDSTLKRLFPIPILLLSGIIAFCTGATAEEKTVSDPQALVAAIGSANPGDVITITPGVYEIRKIRFNRHGTKEQPITLRGADLGKVFIKSVNFVNFELQTSNWIFENLDIEGACQFKNACEHAFHIKGPSQNVLIRHNRMHGFNSMIKGNGEFVTTDKERKTKVFVFPADVTIEDNIFFNPAPRETSSPVNFVNLDGGRRWIVRGNLIADFAKAGYGGVAHGAYTKGMARDSVIERNLIICELTHHGGIRIGMSFGGGGTGKQWLDDPIGEIETLNGIMRNNIVLNCPNDVGIYINKGAGTKIYNNTLFNTFGIDVRYVESDATIVNNVIGGGIRERDSGTAIEEANIVAGTGLGVWLPGLLRYLQRRIDGQDQKYPSIFDKSDVETMKSVVGQTIESLSATWVGRGDNGLRDLFTDPARGDLSLRDPGAVIDRGVAVPDVTEDFCGTPRSTPPNDLGAIEYGPDGKPRCDIQEMIRRIVGY
jgi:hypothetical protein